MSAVLMVRRAIASAASRGKRGCAVSPTCGLSASLAQTASPGGTTRTLRTFAIARRPKS